MESPSFAGFTAIAVAIIGGGFGVWAAFISNRNSKDTKTIKDVLSNTKSPVDSLDQVIKLLQDEIERMSKRHSEEIEYMDAQIESLRASLKRSQQLNAELSKALDDLKKKLKEYHVFNGESDNV